MNNTTTTAAWQNYHVGTEVTVADGRVFQIVDITSQKVGKYKSRLFHLVGPAGETVTKTSRGLSLWIAGKSGDANHVPNDGTNDEANDGDVELASEVSTTGGKSLAVLIAEAVQATGLVQAAGGGIDRDEVSAIVDERIASLVPQRLEVVRYDGVTRDVGVQHAQFPALLAAVAVRRNVWLVGPAGSGKTSAAHAVAEALGLRFHAKSVGPQTSESSLLGYHDANGKYVRTQLREAFENGGVFLLDEVDAGNPNVLVVINALLANGECGFPDDGNVKKHKDFVLIGGANTIGQGADRQYVGRQQIDAATLTRFVLLNWEYDPRIEASAAGVPIEVFSEAPVPTPISLHSVQTDHEREVAENRVHKFCKKVVAIRNAVGTLGKGVRVIVSPRSSIDGAALIRAGFSVDDALDATVWKGCDADTRKKIEQNV